MQTIKTALITAFIFLSVLPFYATPIPMMPDFFNHFSRYYLLYASSTLSSSLMQYYEVKWSLISNMGMDLLTYPFARIFGLWNGAVLATALLAPLTIVSMVALSLAIWRAINPTLFLALPFVFTYSFLFGFTNYHLSVDIALLATAAWIAYPEQSLRWQWFIFAPIAVAAWVSHLGGWVVLVVLIGSAELARFSYQEKSNIASLKITVYRFFPILTPILLQLYVLLSRHGTPSEFLYSSRHKLLWFQYVLADRWKVFDYACLASLLLAAIYLAIWERHRSDRRLLLATGGLTLLYLLCPKDVLGSHYADERILPVIFIVFFLSFSPERKVVQAVVILIGAVIFSAKLAVITIDWRHRGLRAEGDIQAMDTVPQGARLAVIGKPSICDAWPLSGMDELPSLEIARRGAFVNTVWDQPGSQLVRPIYNDGRGYNDSVSSFESTPSCVLKRTAAEFIRDLPRDRFDYVWSFSTSPIQETWLKPVASAPDGTLYQIRKD